MITKISTSDYLKRYDNMDVAERRHFEECVAAWLQSSKKHLLARSEEQTAELQNVIQTSFGWNDDDCAAFQEGAQLLSAFTGQTDTWLPDMLYTKTARRSIKRMVTILSSNTKKDTSVKPLPAMQVTQVLSIDRINTTEHAPKHEHPGTITKPQELSYQHSDITPARPKHIDQYVHLLPAKTQERAAQVRGLLRDLDAARENARLLMNAGEHGDKIAQWARAATTLDAKVKSIYKELDEEWNKLMQSGRIALDAFGNAHVVESEDRKVKSEKNATAIDTANDNQDKTNQQKAALLRKWLIDTRNAKSEKQTEKWVAKYKEMVSVGGMESVTDKVRMAAKHYGIDIEKL